MNYLIIYQRKSLMFAAAAFIFLLVAPSLTKAQTAQRKFKPGDQIPMGSKIYEIVECRIKPNTRMEECDYMVVHEDGSTGSIFTQSVFELRRYIQQNEAEKKRLEAINRRNQPKPETEETDETIVPPSEIPGEDAEITVTAKKLYDDYSNNDEAAKRKYVGKTVRVTGAVVYTISQTRFSAKFNKIYSGSTIQCYVEDLEQIPTLNKGEILTIVGVPLGSQTSTGVIFEPCRIERKTAGQMKPPTAKPPVKIAGNTNGKIVGTWYYTTIINADGTEKKLSNSESYLWLKEDGSYEHRFGTFGQIGNFAASANRLTLNREDGDKKVYTMTIEGTMMTLRNASGGYKLERE